MWARRLRWRLRRRRVRQGEPRRCRKDPKTPKLLELHPAGRQACCPAEVGWRKPSGTTSGTAAPIPQGCLVKIADTRIAYGCFEKASILLLPLSPSALSRATAIDNPRVTRDRAQWMVDLRVRHATQSTIRAQWILLCSLNTEWLLGL
ncbi:hypothetical protein PF004_g30815 [Phytophthora fragariae]|uniref:Uncharacterized protein n=1 Tax=Phytophthora fragariae TaxID=53985 RepID=A0A6G0MBJ7_9STRA|nr:hypothetical protein PF004_g30815 [Phytophthora fragariae]